MKQFVECVIDNLSADREILLARLSQLAVESIWEDDDIKIYIDQDREEEMTAQISELSRELDFHFHFQKLENKNWNARWESDFKPVEIDRFVRIRAVFHEERQGFDHELIIQPKMAFGTGHHATTWMMVKQMASIRFVGKKVWDFGTGTGILAILASRLGAYHIEANDIEDIAIENACENQILNNASDISFKVGGPECVSDGPFDVILANINRNVLISSMQGISRCIDDYGILVLSGILTEDESIMKACLDEYGFSDVSTEKRGEWLCMICKKDPQ